jgi:hypothetical protein
MSELGNLFADLDEDMSSYKPKLPEKQDDYLTSQAKFVANYKCSACNGTGVWQKTYYYSSFGPKTYKNKCFKCQGKGGFKTSPEDRAKAKKARVAKKEKMEKENIKFFNDAHPEELEYIVMTKFKIDDPTNSYKDFLESLMDTIYKYGELSEKQLAAVQKGMAKAKEWEAKKNKPKARIDLTPIREKLAKGKEKLKKPVIRAGDTFKFTFAPETGKNAGYVYVRHHDQYIGKVAENGDFFPYQATPEQITYLKEFAKDPIKELKTYGRNTGNCGLCGRGLSVKESVKRGYGPICADNYGLPYNHTKEAK